MPQSMPVAASASQTAQMLSANSASTSASPSGGGDKGETGFSNHLKAEQRSEQKSASARPVEATEGRTDTAEKPANSSSKVAQAESTSTAERAGGKISGKDKGKAGGVQAEGSRQAPDDTVASKGALLSAEALASNLGLQRAPALGLSEQGLEAPFATMGERVLALLGAEETNPADAVPSNVLTLADGGNEAPLEDAALPQQGEGEVVEAEVEPPFFTAAATGLESPPGDGEILLPMADDAIAAVAPAVVASAEVAASLRQGSALTASELEAMNTAALKPLSSAELATVPHTAAAVARPVPGKALTEASVSLDVESVDEVEADLDAVLNPNQASKKPTLFEASVVKPSQPVPVAGENLTSTSSAKDNFAQVRQNIMAALAGKSDITKPLNVAIATGGHEVSEAAPQSQSLNLSNLSSSLALSGGDPAKYSATQEASPQRFFTLQTPAGQPGWDVEMGNRIRWMVGQNNSGVELRLNPPELGSIEVKLVTEGERTSVTFFSSNPAARDVLDAALPRLREMFAESGMDLANADVADRGLQQEREQLADSEHFGADGDSTEPLVHEAGLELTPGGPLEGRGVIDYFV